MPRNKKGSKKRQYKVLSLYEERADRRPINVVMFARVALFPPIRKRTPNTNINAWIREYKYASDTEKETTIFVKNIEALTFTHKRVFDSLLLSAMQVFKKDGKTELRINPYKLKKIAGLPADINNVYLLKIVDELQSLQIKVCVYYPAIKKTRNIGFVPVVFYDTSPGENKKAINPRDNKREFFEIILQDKFVKFLQTKIVYSITPSLLQQMHTYVKNPYLDYAFKYLLTQTKKQRFELFTLLEKLIFQENLSPNIKKKVKKDTLTLKEKHSELLEKLGISVSQDVDKIYLTYTPTPAVTLFFPHRHRQSKS